MKIVLKLNKLGRDFQLIDGTPSPEMQAILKKFHFEKRTKLRRYNVLVKRGGLKLKSSLLKLASLGKSISPSPLKSGQVVIRDPARIERVTSQKLDGILRRMVTKESLLWMSSSGHGERHFFGLIDKDSGELAAFAIGLLKSQRGVNGCRILEYGSFDETGDALIDLISNIANHPTQCGLPKKVDLLLWSVFENSLAQEPDFKPEIRESTLYFKLPTSLKEHQRLCLPSEGDLVLL